MTTRWERPAGDDAAAAATATWRDWSCAVSVTVNRQADLAGATTVVRHLMGEVDRAVSRFRDDSELELVNRNAGRLVPVGPLTFHLVQVALDAARDTRGAVDPTVGADLIRIGYDADIDTVRCRTNTRTSTCVAPTCHGGDSWRDVVLDQSMRRIGLPVGARLDLGATAKAWTADEAARRVHRRYGGAVLVGLGGDLAAAGCGPRPWRIDVAETEGAPAVRVGLSSGGLATSSVMGRRWSTTDGTAHHIVDPRTGAPATSRWRTATVWAPTALTANVMSTWALVDGAGAIDRLVSRGLAARLTDVDGTVMRTARWPRELEWKAAS